MVQRSSLYGTVSPEERIMATKCLRSISGMYPRHFEITREVWEPKYRYDPTKVAGQTSQIEQYRLFLIKTPNGSYIESYEIPEAGRNIKVVSQSVLSSRFVSEKADSAKLMNESGYEHKSTQILKGEEYVLHEHVLVRMFQIHDQNGRLLDESQQNAVSAYIDVESVRDLTAVERGTQILLAVQQELRGIVALRIPNRNSFNTRMPRIQV